MCVMVHLCIIVFFRSVLFLSLDKTTTNLNGVQFVGTDAPVQYLLASYLGIKGPLAFAFHDRNGKRKIIVTHQEYGAVWIFLIYFNRVLFLCLFGEGSRAVLILNWIFRSNDVIAIRSQNFLRGGGIEIFRYLNKRIGSLLWCVELFLLRCPLRYQSEKSAIKDRASNHEEFRRSHNICFRFHLFFLIECLSPSSASATSAATATSTATATAATAPTAAHSATSHAMTPSAAAGSRVVSAAAAAKSSAARSRTRSRRCAAVTDLVVGATAGWTRGWPCASPAAAWSRSSSTATRARSSSTATGAITSASSVARTIASSATALLQLILDLAR